MKVWCYTRVLEEPATLYSEPSDSSTVIQQLQLDTEVLVCSFKSGWVEARLPDGPRGFIKGHSKFFFKRTGTLHDSKISLFPQPDRASLPIRSIAKGESITLERVVKKDGEDWFLAKVPTGEEGYVVRTAKYSKTEKIVTKEETWSCQKCFEINPDTLKNCRRCGAPAEKPAGGSSQSALSATPQSATSYANQFGKYGGYAGFAAMFLFPRVGGIVGMAIVGAICGGGGAALGSAVGLFFDSVAEEGGTSSGLPDKKVVAVASLILGIAGLVAWFLPIAGLPVTITGFVLGSMARRSSQRGLALAGMGLSLLGLLLSAGNAYLGAMLMVRAGMRSHGY